MIYLLLAILCSAAFAMSLKWSLDHAVSKEYVLVGTYLSAFMMAGLALLVMQSASTPDTPPLNHLLLVSLSILTGIIHYAAFKLYQSAVEVNGIAITGAFAKMGILIPTVISMFVWNEFPSMVQGFGIAMTLIALFYYYAPQKEDLKTFHISYLLLILMIVNGSTDFMTKIFQKTFPLYATNHFLTLTFLVGLIISLIFAHRSGKAKLKDIATGSLIGIPIVFSFYFLIMALDHMIAAIVFPVFSAGSLVAITLVSIVFFKEMPGKKEWITIVSILAALILINL
jgi:drug/metabolite transporter (DMT)-like permease